MGERDTLTPELEAELRGRINPAYADVRGTESYERKRLLSEVDRLRQSVEFYKRRCDTLQEWQSKMRDPERTIVCDVLANGCTLSPDYAGDRYTVSNSSAPTILEGWKLVPKEPTVAMQEAGCTVDCPQDGAPAPYNVYKDMLAAAPDAPHSETPNAKLRGATDDD